MLPYFGQWHDFGNPSKPTPKQVRLLSKFNPSVRAVAGVSFNRPSTAFSFTRVKVHSNFLWRQKNELIVTFSSPRLWSPCVGAHLSNLLTSHKLLTVRVVFNRVSAITLPNPAYSKERIRKSMTMNTNLNPTNVSNLSPLSTMSVNLHHHNHQQSKRQESVDLFSPKGRPMHHRSVTHRRSDSRGSSGLGTSKKTTPAASPTIHHQKHTTGNIPMTLRLRRMKRRLLQEHTKDHYHQSEVERNL